MHNHVLQLAHQVAFLGFLGVTCYHTPDNDIRVEIVAHHVRGKIIVNAPVIHQHAVHFDRLEYEGKAHGGAHSIAQIPLSHHHGPLVVDIRRHATERHEKVIEISSARCCGLSVEAHERQVHLYGIHHAGGETELWLGAYRVAGAEREAQVEELRRGEVLLEVVGISRLHHARIPPLEVGRAQQIFHFIGRISHSIERADDGAHRGAGDVVDGDAIFFQSADDADVRHAFGASTAQHETHTLGMRRKQEHDKHHYQEERRFFHG